MSAAAPRRETHLVGPVEQRPPPRQGVRRLVGLPFWAWILLAGVAVVPYLAAIPRQFVGWDDVYYITANPVVIDPGGLWRIWFTGDAPQYYPLAFTSYWLEYRAWGEWAGGYYLTNVALHVLSSILVVLLARRLGLGAWPALLAGALFALHPLQAGSVAWLAQRKNTLALAFGLLAFLLYFRSWQEEESSAESGRGKHGTRGGRLVASGATFFYLGALAGFLAAMLSKTAILVLPLSMWLADAYVLRRPWRASLLRLIPFVLLGLPPLLISAQVEAEIVSRLPDPAMRPLGAAAAIWFYLTKIAWPAVLLPIYARWTISAAAIGYWLAAGGLVLVVLAVVRWRHRLGDVTVWGLATWLILLAPGLGFVRFGHLLHASVADHLVYLPSFGIFIAVAAALERVMHHYPGTRDSVRVIAVLALLALGAKTLTQARLWANPDRLWSYTLAHNPDSFVAHGRVGWQKLTAGQSEAALAHFRAAVELDPEYGFGHSSIGAALAALGRPAEALPSLRRAIELEPQNYDAYFTLGVCLTDLGQPEQAIEAIRAGLRVRPDEYRAHANLAVALAQLGRLDEAAEHFETALRYNARQPAVRGQLAKMRLIQNRPEDAVREFEQVARESPLEPSTRADYAEALRRLGRQAEADRVLRGK